MFFGEAIFKSMHPMPMPINMISHSMSTSLSSAGIYARYVPSPSPSPSSRLLMNMNSNNVNDLPIKPKSFNKGFKLPPKIQTTFEVINSHPNDALLTFEPIRHVYTYNRQELKTSVTSFVESYFSKFNADEVIPKMMSGMNWPRPEYTFPDGSVYNPEQIKKKWDDIGEYARNQGKLMSTVIHLCVIALFVNNPPIISFYFS